MKQDEEKLQWFINRYRQPFHRLAMLLQKEELIEKKPDKFSPMGISNLYELLLKMKISPRVIPQVFSCMVAIPGDYKTRFKSMLDPYRQERNDWASKLKNQRKRFMELDTSPWSSSSPRGLRERELEMEQVAHIITDLESKLGGLPGENTFTATKLYHLQTNEELQSEGLITDIHGTYPRFTEKGLKVYTMMDQMVRYSMGRLTGPFSINTEQEVQELAMEVWNTVKGCYVGQ